MPRPTVTLPRAIDKLFADPRLPRDLALQLLNSWLANLQATEALINRNLIAIVGLFLAFLALDTGVIAKLTFQGGELHRTGVLLCAVPVTIAYLYYRYNSQVAFAHDLRTAIALLYKNLFEHIYYGALDLLTHIPSLRNLETYDSLRAPPSMLALHRWTTWMVTAFLLLAPPSGLAYTLVRLWHYDDVGVALWVCSTVVSLALVLRAWLFGIQQNDEFSVRVRTSPVH